MTKWITAKEGVRYREHPTRKHGVNYDRYYVIRYRDADGNRKEESLGWASKAGWTTNKAGQELHKLKANHSTGSGAQSLNEKREIKREEKAVAEKIKKAEAVKSMTFTEVFDKYLIDSKLKKKNEKSWKREEQLFRLHISPVMGKYPLTKIAEVPHLRNLRKNMEKAGLSPATIRYALHVVRIVFHFAIDEEWFSGTNPALEKSKRAVSKKRAGIEYPQQDNEKERYLSREEAEVLMKELAARSTEVHDMAMLALYAGMRFGEIAKLTWGDVKTFEGTMKLRQTKNGKDRTAYMTPDIQKMFAQRGRGEDDRLVFPARVKKDSKPEDENKPHSMISHLYYAVVKKLFNQGVADKRQWVNFHTLRHTFASWLVENGTDIYKIKDLLGHGTLQMTERYAHHKREQLKEAVVGLQNK
ncbi:tyrosine-type recombinase/integrase [Desulfocastanea catecholica]